MTFHEICLSWTIMKSTTVYFNVICRQYEKMCRPFRWSQMPFRSPLDLSLRQKGKPEIAKVYISVIAISIYGHLWALFMINVQCDMAMVWIRITPSGTGEGLSHAMMNVWKWLCFPIYFPMLNLEVIKQECGFFMSATFHCVSTCDSHAIQRLETIESRPSYFLICFWYWFVICFVASSAASFLKITEGKRAIFLYGTYSANYI